MNNLDLFITILIALPAFFGFRRGFLRSVFSLAGIVAGLIAATRYSTELSGYLKFLKIDSSILTVASFILILVLIYSILTYFAGKISRINMFTKSIDSILGLIFGALKGVIITSLLLIASTKTFSIVGGESIGSSKLYPFVINFAPDTYNLLMKLIPDAKGFYEEFEKSAKSIIK